MQKDESNLTIRDIDSIDEMTAVEDLQIAAWGDAERDIVPLNHLVAARHVGGTLVGAFDGSKLAGFAYGFYGHVGGRVVHHSHMLAVHPDHRGRNLGFQLKLAQRDRVLNDGFTDRMTWTFDPLQSLNAHFNFGKLGVISDTYKVDVYGTLGASFLHQNGTDRLFVTWLVNSRRVELKISGEHKPKDLQFAENAHRLISNSSSNEPEIEADIENIGPHGFATIEIPRDINSIEGADPRLAHMWRSATRYCFIKAINDGFIVTDFLSHDGPSGAYIMERKKG